MNGLTVLHHGRCVVALDSENMINASVLAKHHGRNPVEYLLAAGAQHAICQISDSKGARLSGKWRDSQVRSRHKPDYLRALESAGIIRRAAGDPGGHVAAGPGIAGNGIRNYAAGLWIHSVLATGLARWLECRGEDWKPSPLAELIEQVLTERRGTSASHTGTKAPESAADSFAGAVDARTLENLREVDQILINGNLSFSERQQTLQARLEQQARRES